MSGFRLKGLPSHLFSFRSTFKSIKIITFGLVQTKPILSKTASVGPGPVRPSGETGPDQALSQTGSIRTGGIIAWSYAKCSQTLQEHSQALLRAATVMEVHSGRHEI